MTLENAQLLLRDSWGIYIPQHFLEITRDVKGWEYNVKTDSLISLNNGPEDDWYWDAWEELLDQAVFTDSNGTVWQLYQEGDLWAVPVKDLWRGDDDE